MNRELQGDTLVVRIPMRFRRQGRRKRILAPDGSDLAPPTRAQPDGTRNQSVILDRLEKGVPAEWEAQRGMLDS